MRIRREGSRPVLELCDLPMFAYQVDPYTGCEHGCVYCYTLNAAGAPEQTLVKDSLQGKLQGELSSIRPQTIYMGMNTDPYQPCEEPNRETRSVLEVLADEGFSACILTKSDLCTRDVDLFRRMPGSSVGFSFAFQDEDTRRLFEPAAPSNERRIKALEALKAAGVETYALVSPIMPYITEPETVLRMVSPHVDTAWFYALRLTDEKDRNWRNLRELLKRHFPGLAGRFREAAFEPGHAYWTEIRQSLARLQAETGLKLRAEL